MAIGKIEVNVTGGNPGPPVAYIHAHHCGAWCFLTAPDDLEEVQERLQKRMEGAVVHATDAKAYTCACGAPIPMPSPDELIESMGTQKIAFCDNAKNILLHLYHLNAS